MRWERVAVDGGTQVFFQLMSPNSYDSRDLIEHAEVASLLE